MSMRDTGVSRRAGPCCKNHSSQAPTHHYALRSFESRLRRVLLCRATRRCVVQSRASWLGMLFHGIRLMLLVSLRCQLGRRSLC